MNLSFFQYGWVYRCISMLLLSLLAQTMISGTVTAQQTNNTNNNSTTPSVGTSCRSSLECFTSNLFCDRTTMTCAARKPIGSVCTRSEECQNGSFCSENRCKKLPTFSEMVQEYLPWIIAGASVAGGILLMIVICLLWFCCCRKSKGSGAMFPVSSAPATGVWYNGGGNLKPANYTGSQYSSPPMSNAYPVPLSPYSNSTRLPSPPQQFSSGTFYNEYSVPLPQEAIVRPLSDEEEEVVPVNVNAGVDSIAVATKFNSADYGGDMEADRFERTHPDYYEEPQLPPSPSNIRYNNDNYPLRFEDD